METKQDYKVLSESAYASMMTLSVFFEVDGEKYAATADYYNVGNFCDDLKVYNCRTGEIPNDNIWHIAEGLIDTLEIEKHLTC